MTTIQMAPGAMVISTSTHGGVDRIGAGMSTLMALVRRAGATVALWREAYVEAHEAARAVELAAHDPRVLAELRAALQRDPR
jgi:predicted ATPase